MCNWLSRSGQRCQEQWGTDGHASWIF